MDFFATWCGPCSTLGPILEKVAEQFKNDLILVKANVDQFPITSQKFNVEKIPMVVLFKGGKQVNGFIGLIPEKAIKELPKDKRYASTLSIGISEQTYKDVCEIIENAQERNLEIADKDPNPSKVYQAGFFVVPVSK